MRPEYLGEAAARVARDPECFFPRDGLCQPAGYDRAVLGPVEQRVHVVAPQPSRRAAQNVEQRREARRAGGENALAHDGGPGGRIGAGRGVHARQQLFRPLLDLLVQHDQDLLARNAGEPVLEIDVVEIARHEHGIAFDRLLEISLHPDLAAAEQIVGDETVDRVAQDADELDVRQSGADARWRFFREEVIVAHFADRARALIPLEEFLVPGEAAVVVVVEEQRLLGGVRHADVGVLLEALIKPGRAGFAGPDDDEGRYCHWKTAVSTAPDKANIRWRVRGQWRALTVSSARPAARRATRGRGMRGAAGEFTQHVFRPGIGALGPKLRKYL